MGWFKNITKAVSKAVSSVGEGLTRAAGGKQNLAYAIAAVAVVATAGAASAGLPALIGTSALTGAGIGTSFTGATIAANTIGGAVVGAGIGAAAGAATGSLTADAGKGLLKGAAAGGAAGGAGGLAGGLASEGLTAAGVEKGTSLFGAGTGAASGAASGAARTAVAGGDIGKAAALGGVTGGVTGGLFPTQYDESGKAIQPSFGESLAKAGVGALTSYGLQQAFPETFAQPTRSTGAVSPTTDMAGGAAPYATQAGPSALAAGLRVGQPDLPAEGAGIPGEKTLEPKRPVWNISSLRTQEEAA